MKRYIFICLLSWLTVSCSDFLEEYSQDLAKVESYTDLDELLIGDGYWYHSTAYNPSSYGVIDGDLYLMPLHLMSDETEKYRFYKDDRLYLQDKFSGYITWQRQVGRDYKTGVINSEDRDWNELYKRINIVNQVIGEIDGQPEHNLKDALEKTRIKGEAYFLRAVYYFTLVNMYARPYVPATAEKEAGIPIKLTQAIEDKDYESASLSQVYSVILEDLTVARECLSQTTVKNHPYRADIVAAHMLTSRVYLYMQDWQQAYNYADSVIQRKGQLENLNNRDIADTTNFLNRSSVETIFTMGGHLLAPGLFGTDGTSWGSKMIVPNYTIPAHLVEAYGPENDDNDLRRGIFIRKITPIIWDVPGTPVWVFNKVNGPRQYKNGRIACDVGDVFLMRTAEAYLNGAEAAAHLGNTAEATRLLKALRENRVKTETASYGTDEATLIDFVRKERERELCLEGHRWFDLRRYRVDSRHPFKKQIVHYYVDFQAGMDSDKQQTLRYVLEEDGYEDNYTLALPKEVTDFQNTLASVSRRDIMGSVYNEWGDLTALGREDGLKHGRLVGKEDSDAGLPSTPSSRNERYADGMQTDLCNISEYSKAYQTAFAEGYRETYVEKEKSEAQKAGEKAGTDAAQYEWDEDAYDGKEKYYDDSAFESDEEKAEYKKAYWDAYNAFWKEIFG